MAEKSEDLKTSEDKIAQAKELFARGSRNYLVKSYNDAADDLSQVCNIYEEVYGQLSDELGIPYLLYAKSLIILAEDENKVLSVPDEQKDDDDEGDEEEDEEEGGEENDGDNNEAEAKQAENADDKTGKNKKVEETAAIAETGPRKINGDSPDADSDANIGSTNGQAEGVKTADSSDLNKEASKAGTSNGVAEETNEENEDEDDGANLQVAWEILELAVKIFERQGEPAASKLAEAYNELAGISFENSHFDAAIADFKKSLEIHMKLPDDNRRIVAEIHYKIGLAHLMQNSFDDCILELKRASELIDEEIEEQKQKENQTEEDKTMIKDLEETKQDILGKIVEVEETKTQSIEDVRKELSKIMSTDPKVSEIGNGSSPSIAAGSSSTVFSSSEKSKPTDISHLIKRKKPDSAAAIEAEASPAKRPAV